ncbi:MAG TPA: membrane dipeptidase [Chitinophagales bacterium]|nr:membrane dipeptidase [Chitinophagales bacterium]
MMKILFKILLGLAIIYGLIIFIVPNIIDEKYNPVTQKPPYKVSPEAQQLFNSLDFIADLHCDALLWKRDLNKKNDFGQVDIPRLIEGKVSLQAFTIVSKVPFGLNVKSNSESSDMLIFQSIASGRSPKTWFSYYNRAIAQCRELRKYAKKSDGKFRVLLSSSDLENFLIDKKSQPEITAGFIGLEGLYPLEGKIENIEKLYQAGVRMMAPVHFIDNELGGSAHGLSHKGLTEFGKKVIQEIEKKNIILDIAHSLPQLIDDVLEIYHKPIISSHTGVQGNCPSQRNLSDKHLKAIAQSGGLIGIAFFQEAICGTDALAVAKAIKYTVDLIGADYVALGSDFDGSITAPFDITGLNLLVEEMMNVGLTSEEIRKVMGDNVKNFWLKNL